VSPISRALVFHGPGLPLELREFPTTDPEGSEVLVEVVACTLCGSDIHTMQGRRIEPVPTVLGHEVIGRISRFGPTAARRDAAGRPLDVGDRVTWAIVASCGECFFCQRSLPQKCERRVKYGHEALAPRRELTGGLAEHCLLAPGSAIFRVPDRLSDEVACPANCATATVAGAIEALGDLAGRSVLILGCGMLGVTACAWAGALGAASVIACELDPDRRTLARTFGATHAVSPDELAACVSAATGGRGVDAAIELTGSPEAFDAMSPLVRIGGTIVVVGATYPARPVQLVMEDVVRRCLTIRGLHNYAWRHLQAAIEFLDAHPEYPFASMVTAWNPLERVAQAVASGLARGTLRLGVRPVDHNGRRDKLTRPTIP
jgi:putative phosphonate catabolism associated alcohol dehydrogenase